MFNFCKQNIIYIAILLIVLELVSCIINPIGFECLFGFLISLIFASLTFFLNCIVFKKGYISDKDTLVLLGIGTIGIVFCVISFIKKDSCYTFLSLLANVVFITEFILIKIFDIKLYS